MAMKVRKEWLCDENNEIVKKPLSFWFEYYSIKPLEYKEYRCFWKTEKEGGKRIDIEKLGGYGLMWDEYEQYKDKLFFVGNADLTNHKLRQVD